MKDDEVDLEKLEKTVRASIREQVKVILKLANSLKEAVEAMKRLRPKMADAACWGLWDGYKDRPKSMAGLLKALNAPDEEELTKLYDDGYQVGQELAHELG